MISMEGVTKRYGDTTVVDAVDLVVPDGGVVALIGPNGAGKSTLLSIAGRLLDADAGRVLVDGDDVATTDSRTIATRLSILRQENHVAVRLTVADLVAFGRHPHTGGHLGDEDRAACDAAIAAMGLEGFRGRRLDQLSGGQRQRAFIAMVLAQETPHVLLDEPLNNLDLRHAAQTMDVVRRLADEHGRTVVVVLHDVNVASHHADRIVAMREGRVVADGRPGEVVTREVLREVFDHDVEVVDVGGRPVALHFAASRSTAPEVA
ncbi:ABC transporter ATP-binding protein [Euzebya sp.]|uniref:iron ABC transporter ATP-binding protein n=1 Tax=Euzebya sp. TaxID=1971409 RepID=UPI003515BAD9